ncbi:MAG TPA: hypothetical protein VGM65_14515 [Candidatus Udaeobacter sp.]
MARFIVLAFTAIAHTDLSRVCSALRNVGVQNALRNRDRENRRKRLVLHWKRHGFAGGVRNVMHEG